MKNKIIHITILFLLSSPFLISQNIGFEIIQNDAGASIGNIALELDNNDLIISAGTREEYSDQISYVKLLKLSENGVLLQEKTFNNDSLSLLYLFSLHSVEGNIIAIGRAFNSDNSIAYLWFCRLTEDLEVQEEKFIQVGDEAIAYLHSFIEQDKIYCAGVFDPSWPNQPFIFVLSLNGEMISSKIDFSFLDYINKILKLEENDQYLLKGNHLRTFDNQFNELENIGTPFYLSQQGDIIEWTDTSYLISGKYRDLNTTERDIGLGILSKDWEEGTLYIFGKGGDTIDFPGFYKSIDYQDKNKLYCGGTSNMIISINPYQSVPSWYILTQFDSLVQPRWEKLYGGDAYYHMYGLLATSDGGCLMYGSKHDYENNPGIIELYLLKVDANGNFIVSTSIPIAQTNYSVYPNPFHETVEVKVINEAAGFKYKQIELYDQLGRLLLTTPYSGLVTQLSTEQLPSGIYYIVLRDENLQIVGRRKVVKE